MMATSIEVTEYHLGGEGIEVVFRGRDDESMELRYNGKTFSGRALSRERSTLGLVVSILLEAIPDLHTLWLSVVIPAARRDPDAKSISVSTLAVFTTKRTSIAGPAGVSGQIDGYKVIFPLNGNAW